ncbi:MAG: hypothetical protein LUD39_02190 [Opitutae bacterium]|nr:hypothetical protein [Opitutae bacterium]MCD8298556.1 hypothetical protein [Opitutae bacterium]
MSKIFLADTQQMLGVAMDFLPWIILIAAAVTLLIAVVIKLIYLALSLFSKGDQPAKK